MASESALPGAGTVPTPPFVGFLSKYLAVLECDFPVNELRWRDLHLWPLVRILLHQRLGRESLFKAEEVAAGWLTPDHPWRAFMAAIDRRFQAVIPARENPCPAASDPGPDFGPALEPAGLAAARGPVVFFTTSLNHLAEGERGPRDPVTDLWIEAVARVLPTLKLELAADAPVQPRGRDQPCLLVPSWTRETLEARGHGAETASFLDRFVAACQTVCRFSVDRFGFDVAPLVLPEARTFAYQVILRRFLFAELLGQVRPAAVFVTCFYDPPRLGLLWAAAEAGCPTADLQHGANGEYHCGYSHWTAVPPEGYRLLPGTFVVWGASSARHITRWHPPGRPRPRVVIGGRPAYTPPPTGLPALGALTARARRVILVALSPAECMHYGLPALLVAMMRQAPETWLWLVRSHPRLPPDDRFGHRSVAAALAEAGVTNVECRLASELPLESVIGLSHHLVTQFSTCFLDCLAAGVPATFIHPLCLQHFRQEVADGVASLETTVDAALDRIARGWDGLRRPAEPPVVVATPDRVQRLLSGMILGSAAAAPAPMGRNRRGG